MKQINLPPILRPAGRKLNAIALGPSPLADEHFAGGNTIEETGSPTVVFSETEGIHQSWLSALTMSLSVIHPLDLAAILAISGLLFFGLARYLAGPLGRLGVATRKIEQGRLDARVEARITRRHDDIGELGRDLNAMAERVQGLTASQHRLLVDISHEIRSPPTRLTVALGLVRRTQTSAQEPAFERIEMEADQIDELITPLITLNGLETQPSAIRRE